MKPSQFLYSESIKEQKAQKANATKSIGELKPLPKTANPPKDQNSSMIYSLVNLPVKEGQNDTVIFPQSLISQSLNVRPEVVVGKNTEIARSLKKLKPLDSLDVPYEAPKPGTQRALGGEQLSGPKLQTYLKSLNQLTNGLFKKTQTQLLFGSIEPKISHNTVLCVVRIQKLKFFNEYNPKNEKIPPLFCWEAIHRKKSLMKTTPKEFDAAQQDLLDFLYTRNNYEPAEILLWKIKNNDEKYVGQFDLTAEDFQNFKEVLDFKQKIICEKFIEKEMFKSMKQTKSYIGNVQFQLIQLGHDKIPLDKHSGIPGSPRTEEEKARHRIIDAAMSGQEYRWYIDENDKMVIEKIDELTKEIVAEITIEAVQDECGQVYILMETRYENPEEFGRSRATSRRVRKDKVEAHINLLKELDKNGSFTEVQAMIRQQSRQKRVTRKVIEEAILNIGCTANQLLLTECDEFGDCLMDYFLNTDDLVGVLEAMQELKIQGEDEQNLESFSNNLFQNIGQHLRKNTNLKAAIQFIKALETKPETGVLIYNYSYAAENILSETPPFLQNFDSKNYEHVMLLGRLNKMIDLFKVSTKFTKALKKAQVESKKEIYFEIPCFPKNKNLDQKSESLQLKGMGQNVMHEVVRRQKWNKSHLIFEQYPEWFFVADEQNHTPFDRMLETAPFDVIKSLIAAYPDQLDNIFSKFNPDEHLFELRVPKNENKDEQEGGEGGEGGEKKDERSEEDKKFEKAREKEKARKAFEWHKQDKQYRKNALHNLIFNPNGNTSQAELLDSIRAIEILVNKSNENNFEILKTQKLRAGDFIPLGLYLETLRSKCKKKFDRVQRELGTSLFICQILTPNTDEDDQDQNQQGQDPPPPPPKTNFKWDAQNQLVISQILAKLPESIFAQFDDLFRFIKWVPKMDQLQTIRFINLPFRPLIKHKQQQKLFTIVEQMMEELKAIAYDPVDPETEDNKKIMYYFQIFTIMLLDIRNLRSQKLDSVASQIIQALRDMTLMFTELLVADMPRNILDSYYPLTIQVTEFNQKRENKSQKKLEISNLLQLLNFIKFNMLLIEIPVSNLDKLDIKQLAKALSGTSDKETLKDFFRLVLAKDQGEQQEGEEQVYDKQLFNLIVNPDLIEEYEYGTYRDQLTQSQIEQQLLTKKADILLKIVVDNSKLSMTLHNLILKSFQTRKSVGITQQQMVLWLRANFDKVTDKIKHLYFDYFRQSFSLQQIHTLIDLEYKPLNRTYYNLARVYPYIQAQGKNWASILEVRKFAAAIKENINYINLEQTVKSVVVNGQFEKLEIILPYVKDAQTIRQSIHLASAIAGLQLFDFRKYFEQGILNKKNPDKKDDEEAVEEAGGDDKPEDGGEGGFLAPANQEKQQQKKPKSTEQKKDGTSKSGDQYLDTLYEFRVKCYDPTVYFFKTVIKEKKEKYKIDYPKFPEVMDQIRTPVSVQAQLEEMQPAFQIEMDDFIKSSWPKFGRINFKKFENLLEKDVQVFRYLKSWKQSLGRQNIRSVFTQYDSGSGQQSYKKVLNLLIKQYQRYGMPLCDQLIEYERTLAVLMTYGMLNMEQIIFQVASSKFTELQRTNILINLIKKIINPGKEPLARHYQQKNAVSYIQNINRIIKMMNLKALDEDTIELFGKDVLWPLKKALMPVNSERGILVAKLASEVFQRLEQQDLKALFHDHLVDFSQVIKRKIKDKPLLQIANKYVPEDNQTSAKTVKPSYKDVITLFKKKKLDEALEYDIVNYFKQFTDAQCEEIVTELFKLPYDKTYKEELINKFNDKLFEGLIFFRKYRTYNRLINEILFKKVLQENKVQFTAIFKKHLANQELAANQNEGEGEAQVEGEDGGDQAPVQQKEQPKQGSQINLPELAAQFCFYEYFDTLHKFRLRCKDIDPNNCQRFRMCDNQTLVQYAAQFESQGFNYISNCLKLFKFLRENNPFQKINESQVFLAFINSTSRNLDPKLMKFVKLHLEIGDRKIPFYMDTVLNLKSNEDDLFRLKTALIERGVKFCMASDFVKQGEQFNITNDDIRKTQAQRLRFTLDQYLENFKPNDKIKVGYQILNDQELNNIIKQLIYPYKQPEFLIDKVKMSQEYLNGKGNNNQLFQYFLINFPFFWHDDKFAKDELLNMRLFQDFELGLIQFKSTLLFDPQNFEKLLETYFASLLEYSRQDGGEGEEENENKEAQQEESEWEEYERQVTDNEAMEAEEEEDQQNDAANQPVNKNINDQKPDDKLSLATYDKNGVERIVGRDDAEDQKPENDEPVVDKEDDEPAKDGPPRNARVQDTKPKQTDVKAPEQEKPKKEKVKIYKTIKDKRKKPKKQQEKKQFVESNKSLRKQLEQVCSNQVYFQIFMQLALLATTNDDLFRLIQKYLIQHGVLSPLSAQEEFDATRKARLIKDGFKEPFNMKFVEEQEARAKELKTQHIEDIKHIKDVLLNNQKKLRDEQSEVYQALIQSILQCDYEDYQTYIDHLFDNPAYRLLQKNKKQAITHPLEQDQKFQIEIRQYFAQTEKLQLSSDFVQKFFENAKSQSDQKVLFTTDKWIHVISLLNYCKQIKKQIQQFQTDIKDYQRNLEIDKPNADTFSQYQGGGDHLVDVQSSYSYKFKVSNKMEPVIYEYKKDVVQNEFDVEWKYNFKFELTFNIKQGTIRYNPFPIAQLQQKYVEEVVKTYDILDFEAYVSHIEEIIQTKKQYAPQLSDFDDIDFNQLRVKLTKENFKDYMTIHYMKNFYLEECINELKGEIGMDTLEKVLNGIVETESSDGMNAVKINNIDWNLYSSRIRPDIKLKYQDKQYPVPYSNYQPRLRNTSYKQSLQADLAFPELYPLVVLQVYLYIPDILTEEQFNLKYDPLSILQQACFDLNSYSQALDEIITSPPSESLQQYFDNKSTAPQIVYWPLIQSKHKKVNGYEQFSPYKQAHPMTIINYLFQKLKFQVDHEIKFSYNVLSLTEILLFKITRVVQQTTSKRCQLQTAISLLQDWALLRKILVRIADILVENDLNKFKFYYVEVSEIHQNSVFQIKSNKLEGLDQIFRFGQTQFFVHSNVLVIRLNLAVVSENGSSLVGQTKNPKLRQYEGTHQIFKQDKEIKDYIGFIVTLEDMLKQIFTKK